MKTFFTATDLMSLERYRVLANYKKQKVWLRKPRQKIFQRNNLMLAGINIPNPQ